MKTTRIYKELQNRKSNYITNIDLLLTKIEPRFIKIEENFPNYTHHDISHSRNVLEFMTDLLPSDISEYSDTMLYVILLAALLHDVGMGEASKTKIKPGSQEQDILRKRHPELSENYINNELCNADFGVDKDGDGKWFQEQLGRVVKSHGESIAWILENIENDFVYRSESINFQFVAFLLRLADALDYDATRAPFDLYLQNEGNLPEVSKKEWKKQQYISNTVKIRFDKDDNLKYVFFNGRCDSPELFRSICSYFENTLETSIEEINELKIDNINEKIKLKPKVDNKIKPVGFNCANLHYIMDYKKISNLLMGEHLYQDKKIALRELLQNAIDAVLLKKHILKDVVPRIEIKIEKDNVVIEDNGIGMTEEQIQKYFLNIGNSYYDSEDFKNNYPEFSAISHYGIGFLSCFMLSNIVIVKTSSYTNSTKMIELSLKKGEKYAVLKYNNNSTFKSGTQIILEKEGFTKVFPTIESIKEYISQLVRISDYEIILSEEKKVIKLDTSSTLQDNRIDISNYLSGLTCQFTRLPSEVFFYDTFKDFSEFLTDEEYIASKEYDLINKQEFIDQFEDSEGISFPEQIVNNKEFKLDCFKIYPVKPEIYYFFSQSKQILKNSKQAFELTCKKYNLRLPTYLYFYDQFEDYADYFTDYDGFSYSDYENETDEEKSWIQDKIIECTGSFDNEDCFIFEIEYQRYYFDNQTCALLGFKTIPADETKFFVKGIFVNSNQIILPYLFKRDFITNLDINILDKNCIPDITRSKIDDSKLENISYAIARGILLEIYENGLYLNRGLSENDKEFLKGYIMQYFSKENEFCFGELNDIL